MIGSQSFCRKRGGSYHWLYPSYFRRNSDGGHLPASYGMHRQSQRRNFSSLFVRILEEKEASVRPSRMQSYPGTSSFASRALLAYHRHNDNECDAASSSSELQPPSRVASGLAARAEWAMVPRSPSGACFSSFLSAAQVPVERPNGPGSAGTGSWDAGPGQAGQAGLQVPVERGHAGTTMAMWEPGTLGDVSSYHQLQGHRLSFELGAALCGSGRPSGTDWMGLPALHDRYWRCQRCNKTMQKLVEMVCISCGATEDELSTDGHSQEVMAGGMRKSCRAV